MKNEESMQAVPIGMGMNRPANSKYGQFYEDVITGLTAGQKYLSSKYFYDAAGDKLFQDLMACEEYYPTKCELEIFSEKTAEICDAITGSSDAFDLIELGAGDATKSSCLLAHLLKKQVDFTYLPIDISENVISYLNVALPVTLPGLNMNGLQGEYFQMLEKAAALSNRRKVVMFLGSNIGNMFPEEAHEFCLELRNHLSGGDMLLIGFDLQKDPATVLAAYNDQYGITRRFNLNLLERINRELGGNFDTRKFKHFPTYDPGIGSCKSYLVSTESQEVKIGCETIRFDKDECIYMEISQKFTLAQIDEMAAETLFRPVHHFFDSKKWFVDAIWEAV
jgi:L-histidine N-alpha-methyltransferase